MRSRRSTLLAACVVTGAAIAATTTSVGTAAAHGDDGVFLPGNLLVSRSVYTGDAGTITAGVTVLPPGCTSGCAVANSNGSYPGVFDNDLVDGSFGITAPIFVDQVTPSKSGRCGCFRPIR